MNFRENQGRTIELLPIIAVICIILAIVPPLIGNYVGPYLGRTNTLLVLGLMIIGLVIAIIVGSYLDRRRCRRAIKSVKGKDKKGF